MSSNLKLDLAAHIAALRKKDAAKTALVADDAIIFWGTAADKDYLPQLKPCVGSATTFLRMEKVDTLTQVQLYCRQKGITRIVSSSPSLLAKILYWDKRKAPSLSNYAGSYFKLPPFKEGEPEIEIVFIAPLKQLVTVPYAKFIATRMISKLTIPEVWSARFVPTPFTGFELLTATNEEGYFISFNQANCFLISMDIETFRENAAIRCISYTAFFYDPQEPNGLHSESVVLPLDSDYNLSIMRKFNYETKAPKLFQNGKYDISYLSRYNAPVYNYQHDTAHMFHSWYSELPKDLGFLNAFFVREAIYWKDLAETNDLHEYYRYNALDTWGTGNAWLAMLLEAPAYAMRNYQLEFPLVFPCHMSEMRGIARDMGRMKEAREMAQELVDASTKSLDIILDVTPGTHFNVNSPIQMKAMLKILGCGDLKSADAKNLEKARFRHPFNARIIGHVLLVRKARKLISTYLTEGKEFSSLREKRIYRILYALNPHGTDSSRLASREHHFWCGLQIQNIPRGPAVKRTLKADDGFYIAEVDLEQAESRDTAYISGEEALIEAVEHSPDFHSYNASAFFGTPFSEIFDVATSKVLDKNLRDLAKRVNHGANYNMGWMVLIDTMGEAKILLAKQLLGLNRFWGYREVAEYLLEQFHVAYPGIRKVFYAGVVEEVGRTRVLRSTALHHSWTTANGDSVLPNPTMEDYLREYKEAGGAWTRYCFGRPDKSKRSLNQYISHPPQSLNAQTLNISYMSVFNDIAMDARYADHFKLLAQIHDSILFQYRIGHEYLVDMVKERMEIPVTVLGYDKKLRTFVVPAGAKIGTEKVLAEGRKAIYWSETE